nr:hypothetical protein CFP56_38804 [Quercus suber]
MSPPIDLHLLQTPSLVLSESMDMSETHIHHYHDITPHGANLPSLLLAELRSTSAFLSAAVAHEFLSVTLAALAAGLICTPLFPRSCNPPTKAPLQDCLAQLSTAAPKKNIAANSPGRSHAQEYTGAFLPPSYFP